MNYEIALKKQVGNTEGDTETYFYNECLSYRHAVKTAKEYSYKIGQEVKGEILADVALVAYKETEDTDYYEVYNDFYENGKRVAHWKNKD